MNQNWSNKDYSMIRIDELEVFAHHGVLDSEKENGQNFYINAELKVDTMPAGLTDAIDLATNYAEVCDFIIKWMQENTCDLIERVAEGLCREILLNFPLVEAVRLEVRKPEAPIEAVFESVSVEIQRSWHKAYLSIGSNVGDREATIRAAIEALDNNMYISVVKQSSLIETKPYGNVNQDDFLNGALVIRTLLNPTELLDAVHLIENNLGRVRKEHWGPRTIDVDIVFYDDYIVNTHNLIIPHVDMQNREFVLKPLNEIVPYFRHPILNKTVAELYAAISE